MLRELRTAVTRCAAAGLRLKLSDPSARLAQRRQRLDELSQRLAGAMSSTLHDDRHRLSAVIAALLRLSPEGRVRECCSRQAVLAGRLQHAVREHLSGARHRLDVVQRTLHTVSPLATLARGFAVITRAADGALLTHAAQAKAGEEIEAHLADGRFRARVTDVEI
jgi:exodeoxyribonuclease VII large subunit